MSKQLIAIFALLLTGSSGIACTQPSSPVILILDGSATVKTTSILNPVTFDLTGDGSTGLFAWTQQDTEMGFLWIDLNDNGVVDNGRELFGDGMLVLDTNKPTQNGFEALAQYDQFNHGGNADGKISPEDEVWHRLRVWIDRNHDGKLQDDENYTLPELGIVAINLTYTKSEHPLDGHGNLHVYRSSFVRRSKDREHDLIIGAAEDVYFRAK